MIYKPPFTVSARSISLIADISALIERYAIAMEARDALQLRKANKIKTIQSSLAIEGNTLSEVQITDIVNGKKVVAPIKEIQEVKNAIATYDMFEKFDPFSIGDLLKAHGTMMAALCDEVGEFRASGVGVFSGKKVIHVAPPAKRVPTLMADLFHWLQSAQDHLLIRSCVFHYEFEFIHPFADGNGRLGRLWQSLIMSKFHPVFQHLPVETMVHRSQANYYDAINESSRNADCQVFIDYMLGEIRQTLQAQQAEKISRGAVSGAVSGAVNGAVNQVLDYIANNPGSRANAIGVALDIPLRSVQRYLEHLKRKNKIAFRGAPRNGGYYPETYGN